MDVAEEKDDEETEIAGKNNGGVEDKKTHTKPAKVVEIDENAFGGDEDEDLDDIPDDI